MAKNGAVQLWPYGSDSMACMNKRPASGNWFSHSLWYSGLHVHFPPRFSPRPSFLAWLQTSVESVHPDRGAQSALSEVLEDMEITHRVFSVHIQLFQTQVPGNVDVSFVACYMQGSHSILRWGRCVMQCWWIKLTSFWKCALAPWSTR